MAQWFWESYQFSRNVRQCHNFEKLNARASRSVKWSEDPVQMRRAPRAFLGSPHRIHTSLHLVWGKMSLHSSHCREIRHSFESGHLGIHSTWGSKLRVPFTNLLLREGYSWGFLQSWPTSSIESWESILFSRWYGVHEAFLEFLCWNCCSPRFEIGVSGNLWSCLK